MPFNSSLVLEFYETLPGRYIIQTTVHSIVAVIIINSIKRSWNISSPFTLQKLHFIPVTMPPIMIIFYYILDPLRNSPEGRLRALIDIERILAIEYGGISLGMLLISSMLLTTVISIFQEMIPVLKNILFAKKEEEKRILRTIQVNFFNKEHLVNIIEDREYIIFSSTGSKPSIFISEGLINDLTDEEINAAIAHEAAHIIRSARPALIAVYIFRITMFFNPVALIEFRKAVQEEEKICDRMAVEYTGKPEILKSVLRKFLPHPEEKSHMNKSREAIIEERMTELSNYAPKEKGLMAFLLAILLTGVINYFIV
ncbi:MAG: M48 family metalloprotease [Thermodesulfovibrionales bacterium]|nr:M48 family metalloprotease [Thermodesulfovibrionales bacterium]